VRITEDERYVVCHNPEAAAGEAALCEHLLARLTETIAGTDKLSPTRRAEPFDCPCFGSARASRPGRGSAWAGNRLAARVSPQRAYRGSQTSDREP